ncbi:MAG: HIT family protein [Proteobacteria bacterium]|jgi:histidine triad (HIT) family protein|nr:HIT family protein [Pseudomonadota bacterium]
MSVFTKIINGELPSYKIYEDDLTIAILALDQVNLGHTLVVPKQEVDHWFDVSPEVYTRVGLNAQKIGKAIRKATGCARVLTTAVGFEVHHYHLHLIPAWSIADLSFSKAQKRSEAEMKEIQKKIIEAL